MIYTTFFLASELFRTKQFIRVLIMFGFGIFCICAAIFNWDWFFNALRAKRFLNAIGRTPARIIYAAIGIILIALGIYLIWDIISYVPYQSPKPFI